MFVTKKLREHIKEMDITIQNQAVMIMTLRNNINMLVSKHSKYQKGDILKYNSHLEYGGVTVKMSLVDKIELGYNSSIMYTMENGECVYENDIVNVCVCKKSKNKKEK